jgi:hypothetical protein
LGLILQNRVQDVDVFGCQDVIDSLSKID